MPHFEELKTRLAEMRDMDVCGRESYNSAHHEPVVHLHTILEVTHAGPHSCAYYHERHGKERPGKGHGAVADVI